MRKHYIDNLRWLAVLFLFPYHTAMVYNNFGESFYIWVEGLPAPSYFIMFFHPFYMPLLFVLAGISTKYALEKRTAKEYLKERTLRLTVPLVAGILLLNPVQTFLAERFHNGYTGGYFAQYILFFTKETDLTGYHGGFTPANLWFILYLFIISLVALPLILLYKRIRFKMNVSKFSVAVVITLFLIPLLMSAILDIGGKSLGEYFALFILGCFFLSEESIIEKLERSRFYLLAGWAGTNIIYLLSQTVWFMPWPVPDILIGLAGWLSILVLLGFGKRYLNFNNKLTGYLSKASFPIYILHQTCLVFVAYFVVDSIKLVPLQMALIIFGAAAVTFSVYELFRRVPVTRILFGIKK